jgi:hypothetical protein
VSTLHAAVSRRAAWGLLAVVTLVTILAALAAPASGSTSVDMATGAGDGSHPAELQPVPEDGQEQFGEPRDERTERVVRLLRNVLGAGVAIVILLLVLVLPLRLRRRAGDQGASAPNDASGDATGTDTTSTDTTGTDTTSTDTTSTDAADNHRRDRDGQSGDERDGRHRR